VDEFRGLYLGTSSEGQVLLFPAVQSQTVYFVSASANATLATSGHVIRQVLLLTGASVSSTHPTPVQPASRSMTSGDGWVTACHIPVTLLIVISHSAA
jgi:hypothetical protein